MNIDMGDVNDVVDIFAPIPNDSYIVQIVKCEEGETATAKTPKLDLHMRIVSSKTGCVKFKNRLIFQSIIFSADKTDPSKLSGYCKGLVKRLCDATKAVYGMISETTFLNKALIVTTKIEYDEYYKEDKLKIAKFEPIEGGVIQPTPTVNPVAPIFDDEPCF